MPDDSVHACLVKVCQKVAHDSQSADALASFLALLCPQVINICLKGQEGSGYQWLPKDASPHVNVIHVQLCSDYFSALVTWGSSVEESVPIVGGHGHLEFLPAPLD